jgi:hypothetical protein
MTKIDIDKLKREQAERVEKMIERLRNFPEDISDYLAELSITNVVIRDNDPAFEKKMTIKVGAENQESNLQGQQDMQKARPLEEQSKVGE